MQPSNFTGCCRLTVTALTSDDAKELARGHSTASTNKKQSLTISDNDRLHRLSTAISRLEREIELLREYRTRLVADVVTGKLDVREAAARLPDEAPLELAEDDTDLSDETEVADEEAAA